jgi:hypothetical protein
MIPPYASFDLFEIDQSMRLIEIARKLSDEEIVTIIVDSRILLL